MALAEVVVDAEAASPGARAADALGAADEAELVRGLHRRAASLSLTATATTPHSGALAHGWQRA